MNIFPENDASCYVSNITEKIDTMEYHTYKSMAQYCLSHSFSWSIWNRWASRRVTVFQSKSAEQKNFNNVMVSPVKAAFVQVKEKCTDLSVVELEYEVDPKDQKVFSRLKIFQIKIFII